MTAAERIVNLYRRHAGSWAARGTELRERAWIERSACWILPQWFDVVAHIAEDPDCDGRTVWLARRR